MDPRLPCSSRVSHCPPLFSIRVRLCNKLSIITRPPTRAHVQRVAKNRRYNAARNNDDYRDKFAPTSSGQRRRRRRHRRRPARARADRRTEPAETRNKGAILRSRPRRKRRGGGARRVWSEVTFRDPEIRAAARPLGSGEAGRALRDYDCVITAQWDGQKSGGSLAIACNYTARLGESRAVNLSSRRNRARRSSSCVATRKTSRKSVMLTSML